MSPPPKTGSWFKEVWLITKQKLTGKEARDRFEKGARFLELKGLHMTQAQIDKLQAEAASVNSGSINSYANAVTQIGSILTIKITEKDGRSTLIQRTLTQVEMIYIEKNQHLLMQPMELLAALSEMARRREPEDAAPQAIVSVDKKQDGKHLISAEPKRLLLESKDGEQPEGMG